MALKMVDLEPRFVSGFDRRNTIPLAIQTEVIARRYPDLGSVNTHEIRNLNYSAKNFLRLTTVSYIFSSTIVANHMSSVN